MIMMSADSDDRVDPMHARKFTAAVQHASSSGHPVLFRLETKSGHAGGDMIKKRVERTTDEFQFLMEQLGMKVVDTRRPGTPGRRPARPPGDR